MDVKCFARLPRLVAGQFDVRHSRENIRKGDLRLQSGQRRAEAEWDSVTKGKVRVGRSGNVEAMGVFEAALISVGGPDLRKHELSGRN